MIRVYVAGSLSGSTLDYLENCRVMMKCGYQLFRSGIYSPFVPAFDYHFALMREDNDLPISVSEYYKYSLAWLDVSDCVLVLPKWENSKGTIAEIERAKELKIPVFYSQEGMDAHFLTAKIKGQEQHCDMTQYKCCVCGYIYDPLKGDPDSNTVPYTSFNRLLEDGWVCPICGVGRDLFEKIK